MSKGTHNIIAKSTSYTCVETARLVRAALKKSFPGIRFSVTSSTYSMGASISVSYENGPAIGDVERVAKAFAGATFDGMTDCKEYHSTQLVDADGNIERVSYGADYVFVEREISDDYVIRCASHLSRRFGIVATYNETLRQPLCGFLTLGEWARAILRASDLHKGYVGIVSAHGTREWYRAITGK